MVTLHSLLLKRLCSNIWKLKTTSKIRHFVWKALIGASVVSDQLRSRGILVDRTWKMWGLGYESIFHALFMCSSALYTWKTTGLPLPQRVLSQKSVFLNIHHLLSCIKSKDFPTYLKRSILWILWNIWKARNALVFEKDRLDPISILLKA